MMTRVKTSKELDAMRHSGKILATVLGVLTKSVEAGMTTKDIANIAKLEVRALGGQPTILGYSGFPDVICISVNDEVVHGIPSTHRVLNDGDIVSMDFCVTYDGIITDAATSVVVGPRKKDLEFFLDNTETSLHAGISVLHGGVRVGNVSAAIQEVLSKFNYGIVRDMVGHGVGHNMHEEPNIPNYGKPNRGPRLESGMTIAIEPMATLGTHKIQVDEDGWTYRTIDGSLSAHFEHTVLITESGAEILTEL